MVWMSYSVVHPLKKRRPQHKYERSSDAVPSKRGRGSDGSFYSCKIYVRLSNAQPAPRLAWAGLMRPLWVCVEGGSVGGEKWHTLEAATFHTLARFFLLLDL